MSNYTELKKALLARMDVLEEVRSSHMRAYRKRASKQDLDAANANLAKTEEVLSVLHLITTMEKATRPLADK